MKLFEYNTFSRRFTQIVIYSSLSYNSYLKLFNHFLNFLNSFSSDIEVF